MKIQILQKASFILFFLFTQINLNAGERIDGNGNVITKQKTIDTFYKVELETYCNVIIQSGSMPMAKFQVDENLQDIYTIEVVDGVLKVSTKKWPEPTQILLTLQVPFITEFTNSGWGKIKINNLKTKNFTLNSTTGFARLKGEVENLTINAAGGTIDASGMDANSILIRQEGHGKTELGEAQHIKIEGKLGKIYYEGNPTVDKSEASERVSIYNKDGKLTDNKTAKKKVTYVNVKIKNNSLGWKSFIIRGPKTSPFSYGFSMFPYSYKSERVPVGTKFFTESILGREKLLIKISLEDEGKTINLFE